MEPIRPDEKIETLSDALNTFGQTFAQNIAPKTPSPEQIEQYRKEDELRHDQHMIFFQMALQRKFESATNMPKIETIQECMEFAKNCLAVWKAELA